LHTPLITEFLLIVASCLAGVLILAFLFAFLWSWVQRLLKTAPKDPVSTNPR